MYHSQNPRVVEIPDDIDRIEAMSFTPGEIPRVTVTFVLKPGKTYNNPTMLFATNGVESRLLEPTITRVEYRVDEPQQATTQQTETPQIELQARETPLSDILPKKSRGKKSDGGGEV